MREVHRREVLTSTAAGTGIALGVGGAGARSVTLNTTEPASGEVEVTFQGTAEDGYITIDADNKHGDGSEIGRVDFAGDELDGDVEISGEAYDDDTWQSTSVSFPDIDPDQFLEDADLPISPDDIDAEVDIIVDTITGAFDREEQFMDADFSMTVDLEAEAMGLVTIEIELSAEALLTTGESGELEGHAEGMDTDEAEVILVSNDFTIPETGEVIDIPLVGEIDIDEEIGLPADDPQRNYLELEMDLDLAEIIGIITGGVTDSSGTGIPGATVEVTDIETDDVVRTLETGAGGDFELQVDPGIYEIVVSAPGYLSESVSYEVEENQTVTPEFELEAIPLGTVTGTVVNDGEPIAGATVLAHNTVRGTTTDTVTTDSDGTYTVEVDANETYEIVVDADGFDSVRELIQIGEEESETLDFDLSDVLDPGTVTGTVKQVTQPRDLLDGVEVGFYDPVTENLVAQTVSDSDGSYEITLAPATYTIILHKDGYMPFFEELEVTEGGSLSVDVELEVDHPIPTIAEGPPQDLDGDGLYEDIRGDNYLSVLDVQTLFSNIDSDVVQDHSEYFNFSGSDSSEVTIFDVQALFRRVQES